MKSIILAEDDLQAEMYVAVHSLKLSKEPVPLMGQSLLVKSVCLPYFVVTMLSDPSEPSLTLDCRFLNLMRVTKEFVDAQRDGAKHALEMMKPKEKKVRESKP